MPDRGSTWGSAIWAVLRKDALCELRTRYAAGALTMFAVVTLASVSMSLAGAALEPAPAALLWVIIFFCAMAGLARAFVQEQETGTLFTLRLYADGATVFLGKALFNMLLLLALTALIMPLFVVLLDFTVPLWAPLIAVLALGDVGIAAVATLTALMLCQAGGKGALFTVITFPLLLPQFLMAIAVTARIFADIPPEVDTFLFMAGYDVTMLLAATVLCDYLWQE